MYKRKMWKSTLHSNSSLTLSNALKQTNIFFFIFLTKYLFIFLLGSSLLLCVGFLQLQQAGPTLQCGARASSHCVVALLVAERRHWSVQVRGAAAPEAQMLYGMWNRPRPGTEPVSRLPGGFLPFRTPSTGKSKFNVFL